MMNRRRVLAAIIIVVLSTSSALGQGKQAATRRPKAESIMAVKNEYELAIQAMLREQRNAQQKGAEKGPDPDQQSGDP